MYNYLVSRIWQAVLVLWAAFTLSFILLQVLPGKSGLSTLGIRHSQMIVKLGIVRGVAIL